VLKLGAALGMVGARDLLSRRGELRPCLVAIDVGHSEVAPGAVSSRGVGEFFLNCNVARLLLEKVRTDGASEAFIIENEGDYLSLRQRAEAANLRHADFLISIHHDSVQTRYLSTWTYRGAKRRYCDRFHGFSLFVSTQNARPEESLEFAKSIGSHLLESGFSPTLHHAEKISGENRELMDRERGIYVFDDLVVLKAAAMPAVLLECGVIVNRDEEARLGDRAYQGRLVAAVAAAIKHVCANRK
jgi:N-acetylmuramoyl-L-alanine amidase